MKVGGEEPPRRAIREIAIHHHVAPIRPDHLHVGDVDLHARACAERQLDRPARSEEHTSELQSQSKLVCRLLLEKKKKYTMKLSQGTILKKYIHHDKLVDSS